MNIQVPWKMRKHEGPQGSKTNGNLWTRRRFRDKHNVAKRPGAIVEDDLDHLGSVHKRTR